MIEKVISGFQSGVDIAGIRAAREAGFATGGFIPLGFLTEDGSHPEYASLYGAREHSSEKWSPRTAANIKNSDATILIRSARAKSHRGSDLTRALCDKGHMKKPLIEIVAFSGHPVMTTAKLATAIIKRGFRTINVAGSRASNDPPVRGVVWSGIEAWSFAYLLDVFLQIRDG